MPTDSSNMREVRSYRGKVMSAARAYREVAGRPHTGVEWERVANNLMAAAAGREYDYDAAGGDSDDR